MSLTKTIKITLPKTAKKTQDFVAIEYREWNRLHQLLDELAPALQVISAGEQEWRTGKTRTVKSLKELA